MKIFSHGRGLVCRLCIVLLSLGSAPLAAKTWHIEASERIEFTAQEALLSAQPGDTIQLPAGRFELGQELSITKDFITLRGAGMNETTLVYGQSAGGAQAIISYANHSIIEDLGIENHPGDGIKIIDADGATIRRVKVEWTKRGSPDNGAYGLYPVKSSNVLLEDNLVIGASDAGIYVGQSHDIIVRRNRAEYNVAGIEVENSQRADVYANVATNNTGGVLIFNLPNLEVQGGRGTRIFQNFIYENNFKNFAPPGNSVAAIPQGTGILIMSNDDIEIFSNTIERHYTTSIAIVNYWITQHAVNDPKYDAVTEHIYIHDNVMRKAGSLAIVGVNQLGMIAAALSFPYRVPHITYDGIGLPKPKGGEFNPAQLSAEKRICLGSNDHDGGEHAYFGNLQLWKNSWWSPLPGKINRNSIPHDCSHPALPAVVLSETKDIPRQQTKEVGADEVARLCESVGDGVNWDAFAVDCPLLSQYNFFSDRSNPLSTPHAGGVPYELTTPLFSDYASKSRVIFLPAGMSASYQNVQTFHLPVGTAIAKTFYYPEDLRDPDSKNHVIETRLLIRRPNGWKALEYVWNEDSGEAQLVRGGARVDVSWIDADGRAQKNKYQIPNLAQCIGCHKQGEPIGVRAGYLNRNGKGELSEQNQLKHMAEIGRLRGLPEDFATVPRYPVWNDPSSGTLNDRARTYLDMNCAHCHSPVGKANTSALYLTLAQTQNIHLGICKPPIAAGRGAGGSLFDIVPGHPERSVLINRMDSVAPSIRMPELGKNMVHKEGVALISSWIKGLEGSCEEE